MKPIQIINRVNRKLFPAKVDASPAPLVRRVKGRGYYIKRSKSFLNKNEFEFINVREKLTFPKGWNDNSLPKLWLYNLHYFEGLLNENTPNELKYYLIEKWISENHPGKGNGWEAYPNSLRIVNWIKWTWAGNELSALAIQSLAVQTRFLMQTLEFHLLGNHLFANAKALVFAGLFFEGEEADGWYIKGIKILEEQVPEQFLDDGGHFELSPTYHALLTEDLLDILHLLKTKDRSIPDHWKEKAQKSVEWLVSMTRPDSLPPLFNDAAYGITPTLSDILSLSEVVGQEAPDQPEKGMTDLQDSGYFRYEADTYSFFGDAGRIGPDYIPGHAHCDMLSFELFAHGRPVIVNTGTSTYEVCTRRFIERGTASHNTVQVGNREQSEIWGAFRIGRRAEIKERIISNNSAKATCIGYGPKSYQHRRVIIFGDNKISLLDTVSYSDELSCPLVARLHFHPDVSIAIENNIVKAGPVSLMFANANIIKLASYYYASEFNTLIPAKVIEITFDKKLETTISL